MKVAIPVIVSKLKKIQQQLLLKLPLVEYILFIIGNKCILNSVVVFKPHGSNSYLIIFPLIKKT